MLSAAWVFLLLAFQAIQQAHGKAVFAHFMVTNSENYTSSDWETDMKLAKNAHIDAFALNMARQDPTNYHSLEMAFAAANTVGFKLFFSFDYAGNGPWDQDEVTDLIHKYGPNGAYFQHNSQPFVSTFEGPGNADDWISIKQKTNCFFVPDWSSVGAKPAMALAGGVADGLFSWSAWPWGNQTMDTYTDASYIQYLEGKPYMFAVSPWFYTSLPGYNKDWLWKGDSLWVDRWQELLALNPMPEFVQIISWNDYGESHYIGPVYDKALASLSIGRAPYDYITNMPHDGWRDILPFFIDMYKTGQGTVKTETAVFWYRPNVVSGCSRSGTTANTASQLQLEFDPADVVEDRVYVAALFGNEVATVQVSFLKKSYFVSWDIIPDEKAGSGLYFGSVPFQPGPVTVEILKSDASIARARGMDISEGCRDGYQNFNAYVGRLSGIYDLDGQTKVPLGEQECVKGKGAYDFNDLCNFTCSYGYCPVGACTCEAMGVPRTKPKATGVTGYPAEGKDANYAGLCSFACNYGHCPTATCDTKKHPMPIPTVSDFLPPACVAGIGKGNVEGLCSFSCAYGYCPRNLCSCTKIGPLVEPPKKTSSGGMAQLGLDNVIGDLCDFTCSRGYCPTTACRSNEDVEASQITAHWVETPGAQCSEDKKKYILEELNYAKDMASTTADHLQQGEYFTTFFPESLTKKPDFAKGIAETYNRMSDLLGGGLKENFFKISCDQTTDGCKEKGWLAHMNDVTKTMNLCDEFFTDSLILKTKDRLETRPPTLREAQRSRSAIILHETAHTSYAMGGEPPAKDYVYGLIGCYWLPTGKYDRSCAPWWKQQVALAKKKKKPLPKPMCPDANGKEGICREEIAVKNADTYSFVAAGVYFTRKWGDKIPLGEIPPPPSLSKRDACPVIPADDYIIIDGPDDDDLNFQVTGYAHFGDSFAAGMGTGSTTWGSCRVGSNNYGQLLYQWMANPSIPFENMACSGDTTSELNNKINAWKNPLVANVGTLTMGGNDLDFASLVMDCLLTPHTWHWGSTNRQKCVDGENRARSLMKDTSANGLPYKLKEVYKGILAKSGRTDFHLFVAGYVGFFNHDTIDCDQSSFHYWWGGYKPAGDWPANRIVKLTIDLRKELNGLVDQLNQVIWDAVDAANKETGQTQVHFVDLQPSFDGHRWCESGSWHEPDSTVSSTYFFLSSWPDVTEYDAMESSLVNPEELNALKAAGSVQLPDPNSCEKTLGPGSDPVERLMCSMAQEVANDPSGPRAKQIANVNQALAKGDYNSQDIGFFSPINQIKAFHPRSAGMALYRDAIIKSMKDVMG